jgi:hypothetical protein
MNLLFIIIINLFALSKSISISNLNLNSNYTLRSSNEVVIRLENPPPEVSFTISSGETTTFDLGTPMNNYAIVIVETYRSVSCDVSFLLGYTSSMVQIPQKMLEISSAYCEPRSSGKIEIHREYCPLYLKFFGLSLYGMIPVTMSYKMTFKVSSYDKKAEICKGAAATTRMGYTLILMFIYILI